MSNKSYGFLSGLCIGGAITVALTHMIVGGDLTFAGMTFTGLLGAGTTLAGRGKS